VVKNGDGAFRRLFPNSSGSPATVRANRVYTVPIALKATPKPPAATLTFDTVRWVMTGVPIAANIREARHARQNRSWNTVGGMSSILAVKRPATTSRLAPLTCAIRQFVAASCHQTPAHLEPANENDSTNDVGGVCDAIPFF